MKSFKILYTPLISPTISILEYFQTVFMDCNSEGFTTGYAYTVLMESWIKEGEKVYAMIEEDEDFRDYVYNAGTEQRPLYFVLCDLFFIYLLIWQDSLEKMVLNQKEIIL